MDRLTGMAVFTAVVDEGGFTAAARRLGLSKSTVSKQVRALEDRLGAQLLVRTTRKLGLTEVGAAFYERAGRILAEAEAAEAAVSRLHDSPRGVLRVTAPVYFGQSHLAAILPEYLARWPEVKIELSLDDRFVDLVEEGFDLAVRIAQLEDSSLVARKLAPTRLRVVAAPAYLERRGRPETPEDLAGHDCLLYAYQPTGDVWPLVGPDGAETAVKVQGPLRSNSGDALHAAAKAGLGLALLPDFIVASAVRAGELVCVLDGWHGRVTAVYAVYPPARHLSPKVRTFVDHLVERFSGTPPWSL